MKKGWSILILVIILLVVSGCEISIDTTCGDNYCEAAEQGLCEEDCLTIGIKDSYTGTKFEPGVLYLGLMVHLEPWEENKNSDYNEEIYRSQVDAVRRMAEVFEEHNARATFEAREGVAYSYEDWGDNVLKELYDNGHGIGVHADRGGGNDIYSLSQEDFAEALADRKTQIEQLIQGEVRHVSGICSNWDWVQAAYEAGYEFTTGEVAMCLASMPEENRPEGYEDCGAPSICPEKFHDPMPIELEDRMTPWRMSSGTDWLDHSSSGLVLMPSDDILFDLAEPKAEAYEGYGKESFTSLDIDEAISQIEKALDLVEEDQVNTIYFAWSIGSVDKVDEEVFEELFERVQPYVDSGQIQWATIPEMYDAYIDWEENYQ